MWSNLTCLALLLFFSGCGDAGQPSPDRRDADGGSTAKVSTKATSTNESIPVAQNRNLRVPDGFRGDVHPRLDERMSLDMTAHWTPCNTGRALKEGIFEPQLHRNFRTLQPAIRQRKYSALDLSRLLPNEFESAGQVWSLDDEAVLNLLRQFHPRATLRLRAPGRRAGPDGAFGVLRALSSDHFEIAFRIHAEFNIAPVAWYTPAYFSGRMLVSRNTKTVDSFQLGLPNDRPLNTTLTVLAPNFVFFDIVRVERMELTGGNAQLYDGIEWTNELTLGEAHDKLRSIFYQFFDIEWVSVKQAQEIAREERKPILAVVLWGALSDQSC